MGNGRAVYIYIPPRDEDEDLFWAELFYAYHANLLKAPQIWPSDSSEIQSIIKLKYVNVTKNVEIYMISKNIYILCS